MTAWSAHAELFRPGTGDKVVRRHMTLREAVDAFLLLPEIEQRRCSIIVLDKGALAQAGLGLGAFGILMFHAIRRIAAAGGPESE